MAACNAAADDDDDDDDDDCLSIYKRQWRQLSHLFDGTAPGTRIPLAPESGRSFNGRIVVGTPLVFEW